jgi:hypothetical protein
MFANIFEVLFCKASLMVRCLSVWPAFFLDVACRFVPSSLLENIV